MGCDTSMNYEHEHGLFYWQAARMHHCAHQSDTHTFICANNQRERDQYLLYLCIKIVSSEKDRIKYNLQPWKLNYCCSATNDCFDNWLIYEYQPQINTRCHCSVHFVTDSTPFCFLERWLIYISSPDLINCLLTLVFNALNQWVDSFCYWLQCERNARCTFHDMPLNNY